MATDETVNAVFGSVIEQLRQQSRKSRYLTDPVAWAEDCLGIQPWSKQRDILSAVQEHDHVAVRSCHGSGKSYIASIIAAWWIAVHPVGEAIVVTTAPTYAQVHAILWEDIRKHWMNANQRFKEGLSPMPLPGKMPNQDDEWKTAEGIMLGFGRKPADNNDHGFQGIHRRYVLVIVDESCGIKENLFTAVEAITTTQGSRIMAIGNPDDPSAWFNKFFTTDEGWTRIDVSSFDSPNFTRLHEGHYESCDHDDPKQRVWCQERKWAERWDRDKDVSEDTLPLLPNQEWVDQRKEQWGEDSPLWLSKVLGQFPLQSVNTLFNRDTLNRGSDTVVKPARTSKVVLGVDLSRFGPDYSVVYSCEEGPTFDETGAPLNKTGKKVRLVDFWGGKADETKVDGMESADRVHHWAQTLGAAEVRIDSEGIGGPILDRLVKLSDGAYDVIGMRGGMPAPDHFRWINSRTFWYEKARELMAAGGLDIDPKDRKLESELEQLQYHFKNRYQAMQVETKDDMAKRNLKSPDYADAFIYAVTDMSYVTENPISRFAIGDRVSMSTEDFLGFAQGAGLIGPY